MNPYVDRGVAGTRAMVRAARSEQLTFIAASLAYYALVSVFPLLLLALVVASVVGGPEFADRVADGVGRQLAPGAGDLVEQTLTGADVRGGATVVGVVALAWSGLKVFRGLDVAFSQVYGADTAAPFARQVRDALTALVAVGAGVGLSVVVGAAVALSGVRFVGLLATPALVAGLAAALLPLYYLFPDSDVTVREALPGAVLAATGWALLGTAFRLYAGRALSFEGYGLVGAVLLLVTWFYVGGLVLLLGVVANAVLAGRLDETDFATEIPDTTTMTQDDDAGDEAGNGAQHDGTVGDEAEPAGATDGTAGEATAGDEVEALREEVRDLRAQLRAFEDDVEERTLPREEVERDLRQYVRRRLRRGHARGWGPYLVLLYGTAMTLGAFFYLRGGWAILAMVVVWLSTLGLYALMLVVGATVGLARLPGRLGDTLRNLR